MIIIDKIKFCSKGIINENNTEDNLVGFIKKEKPVVTIDVSHLRIPIEFADCVEGKVKSLKIENIDNVGGFLLIEGRKI
jgi:hypothetical protein